MPNRLLAQCKMFLERRLAQLDAKDGADPAAAEGCDPADALALRSNGNLDKIVRELARRYPGRPLITYGSRIAGKPDKHSDLDLFVLEYDRNAKPTQEIVSAKDIQIDATRVGYRILFNGIRARSWNNNNWFLNALGNCRIYADPDGDARRLRALAKSRLAEGPPLLTPKQLAGHRAALRKIQDSAKKLVFRAAQSSEAAQLARMRCDQLAAQAIYCFYCAQGRWTTSFHRLVEACATDYPELHEFWVRYAHASSPKEALKAAAAIADAACNPTASSTTTAAGISAQETCPMLASLQLNRALAKEARSLQTRH